MAATLNTVSISTESEFRDSEEKMTEDVPSPPTDQKDVGCVNELAVRNGSPLSRDEPVSGSSGESDPEGLADSEGTPRNSDSGVKGAMPIRTEVKPSRLKGQDGGSKSKRKEDKNIEHLLKALSSLSTSEEKLAAMCKKYTDLLEEHRLQSHTLKQTQRRLNVVTREKDQLQSEHSKSILAKSKLESLCRELQRHNKLVKEESLARARDEEEKRKEVSAKFQTTINEIQAQMGENGSRNNKLKEENAELANKLKGLIEQYEKREEHIEKVIKHKELEKQLAEAKLNQANLVMKEGTERHEKEKLLLLEEVTKAKKKLELLEANEKQLKSQLALYTDKYEDFQSTLTKSNEVFGTFKSEMDKMTKKIKKLEKDTAMYRSRWENSHKALLDMADEKTKADKEMARQNTKIIKLEKLCRALQAERNKGAGAESSGDTVEAGAGASDTEATPGGDSLEVPVIHNIQPTSTPPNTPDQSSRSSPVNVNGTSTASTDPARSNIGDCVPGQPAPSAGYVQGDAKVENETSEHIGTEGTYVGKEGEGVMQIEQSPVNSETATVSVNEEENRADK